MAFMMPVMKNDWDIYKSNRSRKTSDCSNTTQCRSRKVSECKSEGPSLSTSPGSEYTVNSPPHNRSVPGNMSSKQYTRANSRNSEGSIQSPCKSASSPPRSSSHSSLDKFHNRVLDKLKRSISRKDSKDQERRSS